MSPETAKALALIPAAPLTLGTSSNDYCQTPEAHDVRAIYNKKGQDMLYVTATSNLEVSMDETGNPARVEAAAVLSTLWTKSPEVLAALDGLCELVDSLRIAGYFRLGGTPMALSYAMRIREETVKGMVAAATNPNPAVPAA